VSNGTDALNAIQTISIVNALPFALLLCYFVQSILLMCKAAERNSGSLEYTFPEQPEFRMPIYGGIFNVMEWLTTLGKVDSSRASLGLSHVLKVQVVEFLKGLLVPYYQLYKVLSATYPENTRTNITIAFWYMIAYVGWICLFIASRSYPSLKGLAWTFFIASGGMLGMQRGGFRRKYSLRSNTVGDCVSGAFFWPQVLTQMIIQVERPACQHCAKKQESEGCCSRLSRRR
jgi:hypothetical protein